ncbi:MAG: peptidylprolyl isomerase [Lachnospiraceae bacterium]|nr:peptidylprolyl isomerase [Lachnospiraceae bacterium]
MRNNVKQTIQLIILFSFMAMMLTGCQKAEKKTEIVLTTEFAEDEVFRIDEESCTLPEINVYMRTSKDQYESVFGSEIWTKDLNGTTLEQQLKDTILARIAQIKVMNLLADEKKVTLSEKESSLVDQAAVKYMASLSEQEISALSVNEDIIKKLYGEYALANKVYNEITKDINPEISDDEARTISVKHILIMTYSLDENGEKVEYTENKKKVAFTKINEILKRAKAGEDFDALEEEYNEDTENIYSFGKGTMPSSFEEAAFNLDTDQISDVVETEYGYHIIKCISSFDRNETDANKVKIVEQRKNEAFNQVYSEFIKGLYSNLNSKLWDSVKYESNTDITTTNFFDVYNSVFESD